MYWMTARSSLPSSRFAPSKSGKLLRRNWSHCNLGTRTSETIRGTEVALGCGTNLLPDRASVGVGLRLAPRGSHIEGIQARTAAKTLECRQTGRVGCIPFLSLDRT